MVKESETVGPVEQWLIEEIHEMRVSADLYRAEFEFHTGLNEWTAVRILKFSFLSFLRFQSLPLACEIVLIPSWYESLNALIGIGSQLKVKRRFPLIVEQHEHIHEWNRSRPSLTKELKQKWSITGRSSISGDQLRINIEPDPIYLCKASEVDIRFAGFHCNSRCTSSTADWSDIWCWSLLFW